MLLVGVFALVLIAKTSGNDVGDVVKYEGIGCYNDNMSRPLPILLKNLRETIDWESEWPSFERVIKECAKLAYSKGFLYFGIQFYGECWTGTDAYKTFDKKGKSTRCVHGVGIEWANYVYMITQDREECSKDVYKTLSEPSRSIHAKSDLKEYYCDKTLSGTPGWFRFTGAAGNSLALKPPYTLSCTTLSGGWMEGSLPEDKSAPVTRKVCFPEVPYESSSGNDCKSNWALNIRVRNCGHFFVYELRTPRVCYLRYCGDTISAKDY